jgi:hypothetical protein
VALLSSFTIEIQHVNAIYQLTEYRKFCTYTYKAS